MRPALGFLEGRQAQPPDALSGGSWAERPSAPAHAGLSLSVNAPSTTTSGPHETLKSGAMSEDDLHRLTSFLQEIASGPGEASLSTSPAFISPLETDLPDSPLFDSVHASPLFGVVHSTDSFESLFPSFKSGTTMPVIEETKKSGLGNHSLNLDPSSLARLTENVVAFPANSPNVSPSGAASAALAFDTALESPLGLSDPSPLSDFLASPLFSVAGYDSAAPSATFSELPLPSPADQPAGSALPSGLPWFPPHPSSSAPTPFGQYGATSSEATMAPPSTVLRELPPAAPHPSPALSAFPPTVSALETSSGSASSHLAPLAIPPTPTLRPTLTPTLTSTASAKRVPTGFRPVDPLPLDAPIQHRSSVLPSATSRKRKTAGAERALAKRGRTEIPALEEAGQASPAHPAEDEDLPADIVAAVERKRLQNTLSARKSRARKQARLQELEAENDALKARISELEALLGLPSAS
ncbi:hypothetical protein JCM8202_003360 [Rhodotorula sphaerocarpa]